MKKPALARLVPPLLALLLGVALGILALYTPRPAPADAEGFSATRAFADIQAFAKEAHTVWNQPSLVPVRDYLRSRLAALGLQPQTLKYPPIKDLSGHEYPLENIAARIPGKSGRYLLLVSHYDSAPRKRVSEQEGSRGAADDGYGLSTMLEVARLAKASTRPLENGVAFLFTDAEETGLNGARAEMESDRAAWKDVDLVINIEARGVKGPAVMFETGRNNLATIELYRAAGLPFAYSFAVDVYRSMPNGTDFTEFLKKGYAGMNFAVLDDLSYYHTPRDNPSNVSLSSLQHYGGQIVPIVMKYAFEPAYGRPGAFASAGDMTYFNWLPGLFVSYPAAAARVISSAVALIFLLWFALELRRGNLALGASLLWALLWLLFALLCLGAGLGASRLLAAATGAAWKLTYLPGLPGDMVLPWVLLAMEVALAWFLASRRAAKPRGLRSLLAGAFLLNLVALALFHRYLPGGTYLFALPVLVGLAAWMLAELVGRPWIGLALPVFAVSVFVPVLHLFHLALTLGALGIILMVGAFPAALMGAFLAEGLGRRAGVGGPSAGKSTS